MSKALFMVTKTGWYVTVTMQGLLGITEWEGSRI